MSLLVATAATTTSGAKPVSALSLMFQLMLGLAVVLGIIWLGARLMRGRVGFATAKRRAAPMAVVARQTLGKGVQLAIVRAGAETYLLGVTSHQVTRLARFRADPADQSDPAYESSDDLPAVGATTASGAPVAFGMAASTARLQSTIRQLQERTLRRS